MLLLSGARDGQHRARQDVSRTSIFRSNVASSCSAEQWHSRLQVTMRQHAACLSATCAHLVAEGKAVSTAEAAVRSCLSNELQLRY